MTDITLYWNIGSQPARAVKTLIDIAKIPCTFTKINLMKLEQKEEKFLQMYPIGKIPLLKSGNFVLGQSGAIMIFLCERYPHIMKYYGQTLQQRAITNQYISWYQNYFRPFLIAPLRTYIQAFVTKKPINQRNLKNSIEAMYEVIAKLDEILKRNRTKFIAGNTVSIADFLFFYQLTNLIYIELNHEKYEWVKRWYNEVYQIAEVKAITHEWYQIAKRMIKNFKNIQIIKAKL